MLSYLELRTKLIRFRLQHGFGDVFLTAAGGIIRDAGWNVTDYFMERCIHNCSIGRRRHCNIFNPSVPCNIAEMFQTIIAMETENPMKEAKIGVVYRGSLQ